MESILQELSHALRQLHKSIGFTIVVVMTLAVGIGATTIMFSFVENTLLRSLPYPASQKLVVITETVRAPGVNIPNLPVNASHLYFWQHHNHSFQGIAAIFPSGMPIGESETAEIGVARVSANFFSILGYLPHLGRTFTNTEEKPGHNVVILTNSLWKSRFNANPHILNQDITLNGSSYQVIGVLPANFVLPDSRFMGGDTGEGRPIEAFIPFGWSGSEIQQIQNGDYDYFGIGRLRSDVNLAKATADMDRMDTEIARHSGGDIHLSAHLVPFQQYLTGSSKRSLLLLMTAVCGILLIACINLANLLLIRATDRTREAAIRLALGATPARLLQKALVEPLVLASLGGAAGILIADVGLSLLVHTTRFDLPLPNEIHLNLPVMIFAVLISIAVALGCGLLPAWRFAHSAPEIALRAESRTSSHSKGSKRVMKILVVGEIATSVVLVLLASLFAFSLMHLFRVNRGFRTEHVMTAQLQLPNKQYSKASTRNAFYQRVLHRLRQLPGVRSAGMISVLPLNGDYWVDLIAKLNDPLPMWQNPSAHFRWISPGYFRTMGIPLVAGRLLRPDDHGERYAIISENTAQKVWPGQTAVGKEFRTGNSKQKPFRVIGIVGNVHAINLATHDTHIVYVPYWYRSLNSASFVVRTSATSAAMASTIRKAIEALDPAVAISQTATMRSIVDSSVAIRRLRMNLLLALAFCSLFLATIGIYGLVSYQVLQRLHEVGIRMALGASRKDVYWLVLVEGLTPVVAGIGVGLLVAAISSRFIGSLLYDVQPNDPILMVSTCSILFFVSIVACLLPARRAVSVDPVQTLRSQ